MTYAILLAAVVVPTFAGVVVLRRRVRQQAASLHDAALRNQELILDRRLMRFELGLTRALTSRPTGTTGSRLLAALLPHPDRGQAKLFDPDGQLTLERGTSSPAGRGKVIRISTLDDWTVTTTSLGGDELDRLQATQIARRVIEGSMIQSPHEDRLAAAKLDLQTTLQTHENLTDGIAQYLRKLADAVNVDAAALYLDAEFTGGGEARLLGMSEPTEHQTRLAGELLAASDWAKAVGNDARRKATPVHTGQAAIGEVVLAGRTPIVTRPEDAALLEWAASHLAFSLKRTAVQIALKRTATSDALTGLANRGQFDSQIATAVVEAASSGDCVSLLLIDIDHFKRVNDTYGHLAGDSAIRQTATTLTDVVQSQRADDRFLVARYGGEELAVLMLGMPSSGARRIAEVVREKVASSPIDWEGQRIPLTVSGGVATMCGPTLSVTGLIEASDAALYEAKRTGRDRVCVAPSDDATTESSNPARRGEAGRLLGAGDDAFVRA